jgi:hypothetical protein
MMKLFIKRVRIKIFLKKIIILIRTNKKSQKFLKTKFPMRLNYILIHFFRQKIRFTWNQLHVRVNVLNFLQPNLPFLQEFKS